MRQRRSRHGGVTLAGTVLLAVCALVLGVLTAKVDASSPRQPAAAPSANVTPADLAAGQRIAFTSDRGELRDSNTVKGFNASSPGHRYEGELSSDGQYSTFISTPADNGTQGEVYLAGLPGSTAPVNISCSPDAVKTHPVVTSFEGPEAPGVPDVRPIIVEVAWAQQDSSGVSQIQVAQIVSGYEVESSDVPTPAPPGQPDCNATVTNISYSPLIGQSGDNEWPTWSIDPNLGDPEVIYSSTRDNPLGDLYLQGPNVTNAIRLTDGTATGTANTQPTTIRHTISGATEQTVVLFTTTKFRPDGSLGTIAFNSGDFSIKDVNSAWDGRTTPPQSTQPQFAEDGADEDVYFTSDATDPYGDVYEVAGAGEDEGVSFTQDVGVGLSTSAISDHAVVAGTAESDAGLDQTTGSTSVVSHDQPSLEATIDEITADQPATRATVVNGAGNPPDQVDSSAVSFSPDGQRIAYSQSVAPTSELTADTPPQRRIYLANADGTHAEPLIDPSDEDLTDTFDTDPVWSPDGNTIAFQRITYETPPGGGYRLLSSLVHTAGATANNTSSALAGALQFDADRYLDGHPSYAPDGALVLTRTPLADVAASISAHPAEIANGGSTTVSASIANNGAAPAENSRLRVFLPKNGLTPLSASNGCTIDTTSSASDSIIVCDYGTIDPGESFSPSIVVSGSNPSYASSYFTADAIVGTSSTDLDQAGKDRSTSITVDPERGPRIARPHRAAAAPKARTIRPLAAGDLPTTIGPRAVDGVRGARKYEADQAPQIWLWSAGGDLTPLDGPATDCPGEPCAVSGRQPTWSPDGLHIAYEAQGTVYVATLADTDNDGRPDDPAVTTSLRAVTGFSSWTAPSSGTSGSPGAATPTASRTTISAATDPAWTPDGKTLLFAGQPAGTPNRSGIYSVALDGTHLTTIAQGAGPESEPAAQPNADLALTLTALPTTIDVDDTSTVTATVTNNGPSRANATVTVTVPAGLTITAVPTACTISGDTAQCPTGVLASTGTVSFAITVTGTSPGAATIDGTVDSSTIDDNNDNNSAEATVTVRAADLSTTISASPNTIEHGASTTITATIVNSGPGRAPQSRLVVDIPTGMSPPTPASLPTQCTLAGNTITCDYGTLAASDAKTLTFTSIGDAIAPNPHTFTATVSSPADVTANNDTATVDVTVVRRVAGVSVDLSANPLSFVDGNTTDVTATVTNAGPDTADATTVTITIPPGMQPPTAALPAGCVLNPAGDTITCTYTMIIAGGTRTITFTSRGTVLGPHTFNATVDSTTDEQETTGTDSVTVTVVPKTADLAVRIALSRSTARPGDSVTATVTVHNGGPQPAENAQLTVHFDARLHAAATPTCAAGGSCSLGTIAPGTDVTFTVALSPHEDGTPPHSYNATSTATVRSDTLDPNMSNNADQAVLAVQQPGAPPPPPTKRLADLAVTIRVATVAYVGGSTIAHVTVRNRGHRSAAHVRLTVLLPTKLSGSATPACAAGGSVCDLGPLAAGARRAFTIALTALRQKPAVGYTATVRAHVTTSTPESTLANNRDSADLPVQQPTLRLLPPIGPPGFVTLAFGEHLPPGAQVTFAWRTGINTYDGPYTVDTDGTVQASELIVRRDQLGRRLLVMRGPKGVFGAVGANMLVVPRTESPPRFLGRG